MTIVIKRENGRICVNQICKSCGELISDEFPEDEGLPYVASGLCPECEKYNNIDIKLREDENEKNND